MGAGIVIGILDTVAGGISDPFDGQAGQLEASDAARVISVVRFGPGDIAQHVDAHADCRPPIRDHDRGGDPGRQRLAAEHLAATEPGHRQAAPAATINAFSGRPSTR